MSLSIGTTECAADDARPVPEPELEKFPASTEKFRMHQDDDRVVVHSLRSQTEHNSKGGVVVAFHPENGRYAVRMDDGCALSVRPGNLRPEDSSRAIDTGDAGPARSDDPIPADPEIQRARSELARRAKARKQEISDAQAATAAAQVRCSQSTALR